MSVFGTGCYKVNRRFLCVFGLWPLKYKSNGRYYFCATIFALATLLVPLVLGLIKAWPDLDLVLDSIPAIVSVTGVAIKIGHLKFHNSLVIELISRIENDWATIKVKEERKILQKHALVIRFLTLFYWSFIWVATIWFNAMPRLVPLLDYVMPLDEKRQVKQLYQLEYYVFDADRYFDLVYVHGAVGAWTILCIVIAIDTSTAIFIIHPCSLLSILAYRLSIVTDHGDLPTEINIPKKNDKAYWLIRDCILLHQDILRYAEKIQAAYSVLYLATVILNMILISVGGVQVILRVEDFMSVTRYLGFVLGSIFHLFFNSLPGQMLSNHSLYIGHAAYGDAFWFKLSYRSRKLLFIMMMRSGKPCEMSAGKFFIMGMECFSATVQAAVSYFTMLTSLR